MNDFFPINFALTAKHQQSPFFSVEQTFPIEGAQSPLLRVAPDRSAGTSTQLVTVSVILYGFVVNSLLFTSGTGDILLNF